MSEGHYQDVGFCLECAYKSDPAPTHLSHK